MEPESEILACGYISFLSLGELESSEFLAESKTFVRKASGLVREVSGFDVLAYNMFMISIGYTLFIVLYWISYPGASLELAIVITTIVSVFQGLTYALLATVYPRSGGDYVYITRIIHPTLGFVMSWNFFVWMLFYLGLNAGMLGFQGLAPMLAGIGFVTNQPNLISAAQWAGTPSAYFTIGIVSIVFYGILLASGMKNYFTFQKIVFVIALASAVVTIVLLATTSQETFITRFNTFSKPFSNLDDTYHAIITIATQNGYVPNSPFSLTESVLFFVWPWLAIGFCMTSASYSGEVKSVKKSQIFGMVGSVFVTGTLFFLLLFLGGRVFGYDFLGAATYLMFNNPSALPIPVSPWFNLFTALLTDNPILSTFILFGWFSWFLVLTATVYVFTSRTAFAWAMDGMLPSAFAKVSERYRTPINTIILSGIGGGLFLAGIAFTTWLGVLSGSLGIGFVFLLASIAAVIFPFTQKDFFRRSGIDWRVLGIPLISIIGGINAITNIVAIYIMITDARAGANSPTSLAMVVGFIAIGFVLFYGMKAYRKKQGVDVELTFRTIPME
jgi:amino acid transporter